MPSYKDTQNKIHVIDSKAHEHLLPVGSVEISEEEAKVLSTPTIDENKSYVLNGVRFKRQILFNALAGIQSQALTNGDAETAIAVSDLQNALKDLPEIDLSSCQTSAEMEEVLNAAWVALRDGALDNVKPAFRVIGL